MSRSARVFWIAAVILAIGAIWAIRHMHVTSTAADNTKVVNPYAGQHRPAGALQPGDRKLCEEIRRAGKAKDKSKLKLAADALYHPHLSVRREAALALGRMGSEDALRFLDAAERTEDVNQTHVIPSIRVARARIKASRVAGLRRMDVFADELGMTLDTLASKSKKAAEGPHAADLPKGEVELATDTVGEMLAELKQTGYDVRRIAARFPLNEAQVLRIEVAGLPEREQIARMLDEICTRGVKFITMEDYAIGQMLLDRGTPAIEMTISRLRETIRNKSPITPGHNLLIKPWS